MRSIHETHDARPLGHDALADGPGRLYLRVAAWLRRGIAAGRWQVGAAVTPERRLVEELGVSRATVRHAIGVLTQEGLLERRHGRGTFVTAPKLEQPLHRLRGFTGNMRELGIEATSRVLAAWHEPARGHVARALELGEGALVAVIERLRLADGVPVMLEACRLDASRVPGVLAEDLSGSLYRLLEHRYGVRLSAGREVIEVRSAERREAERLGIEPGDAVFHTVRIAYGPDGRPIELTRRQARADRCRFRVDQVTGSAEFTPR